VRVCFLLILAVLCLSAKGDGEYSKSDCKEIGYYIAESDAHMYYVGECIHPTKPRTKAEKLRCEGMAALVVYLSLEMNRRSQRGGYMSTESICSDPRK